MLAISIFFLCLWFFTKNHRSLSSVTRMLFWVSLLVQIYFAAQNIGSISDLFLYGFFTCILMAGVGFIIDMLSDKIVLKGAVACMSILLGFWIDYTFTTIKPSEIEQIQLDPSGEILIQIEPRYFQEIKDKIQNSGEAISRAFHPLHTASTNLDDYFLIDIKSSKKTETFIQELEKWDGIRWVEPNEEIAFEIPFKNGVSQPTGKSILSNDPSASLQWHLSFLDMQDYYSFVKDKNLNPNKKAQLYILDTGIDAKHEDLIIHGKGGKDSQGHGTHCAGIAAAITNNAIGVASMAPAQNWIEVHGIQVISDVGFGTQKSVIDGIISAADNGADVISLSLGGITNQTREKAYNDAVSYANSKGAIIVVAAGNAALDGKRYSPANSENVIVVTSVNENLQKSGFSNHVQNLKMGVSAPGEKILSTTPSNTYTAFSGTSMSTPQVAGLIAVLKSLNPTLDTQSAYSILTQTGKETKETVKTGKLIQPYKAISSLFMK